MASSVVVNPHEFVPLADAGRRVSRRRRVRLGDVTATGRLRLDALARYLQDVADDDVDEVGLVGVWVLRRLVLALGDLPSFRDDVDLTTFCSGVGRRFAERRTTVTVDGGVAAEAVALWVYIDDAGRPAPIGERFFDLYGVAPSTRRVTSRLRHPRPTPGCDRRPWPLRVTDADVVDHVNNAASWAAVEDELARRVPGRRLRRAEIEYRAAVDVDETVELRTATHPALLACWLTCGEEVRTSALVTFS